ncbi:MAG: Holliday junction branch migration DNA helicase RuvB [Bacilli bacterium]|nr:Holliday junction branch migration DNA helicase RuvB [Bacilli bacterium]
MQNNIFRPNSFDEFIGNTNIIDVLKVYLFSAKKKKINLDHILLYGPPGVGKTSLAHIIAKEMNTRILTITASNLEKNTDLINVLSSVEKGSVLFIDEIHRLPKEIEEVLYSVLEDFKISINFKNQENTKVLELDVEPFTLIGATTLLGNISQPLRERFGITLKLDSYNIDEIKMILRINANKLDLVIEDNALLEIAKRSRNIPRVGIQLLKRVDDFYVFHKKKKVDIKFVKMVFDKIEIDEIGLTADDYNFIKVLYEKYENKPVSLKSIAIFMNENIKNLEEIVEPYLVSIGFVERTKQGRRLTFNGRQFYRDFIEKKPKINN